MGSVQDMHTIIIVTIIYCIGADLYLLTVLSTQFIEGFTHHMLGGYVPISSTPISSTPVWSNVTF